MRDWLLSIIRRLKAQNENNECVHFPRAFVTMKSETEWPKITEISSIMVLDTIRQKSRCQESHAPSQGSRKECFLASPSFWWPQAVLGLWLCNYNLCLCLPMAFFLLCLSFVPVSKSSLSLYKDTTVHSSSGPTKSIMMSS